MIRYVMPYSPTKDIADSYNEGVVGLKDDDYICFVDGDTIFLDAAFGSKIQAVIDEHNIEAATCYTNRVGCYWQVYDSSMWWEDDLTKHNEVTKEVWDKYGTEVKDVTNEQLMSGHFMLIKKSLWDRMGKLTTRGMLGVDNEIHQRIKDAGATLYLMKGIYIYHKYRFGEIQKFAHLQ